MVHFAPFTIFKEDPLMMPRWANPVPTFFTLQHYLIKFLIQNKKEKENLMPSLPFL